MKTNEWQIIFCSICAEPTPPKCGLMTDHLGFVCDDCLNNELRDGKAEGACLTATATPPAPVYNRGY